MNHSQRVILHYRVPNSETVYKPQIYFTYLLTVSRVRVNPNPNTAHFGDLNDDNIHMQNIENISFGIWDPVVKIASIKFIDSVWFVFRVSVSFCVCNG